MRSVRCLLYRDGAVPAQDVARSTDSSLRFVAPEVAPRASEPLLDVRHLSVRFPIRKGLLQRIAGAFTAVDDVSFSIAPGQTLALVGESGCGKTTTGKALVQLLRGQAVIAGEARFGGEDLFSLEGDALRAARRQIQIIFQDPFASLNPRMRVFDLLEEGLLGLRPDMNAAARRAALETLVDQVGLRRDALERYPHEFSGGQRQRIAIARALAVQPKLIVCDEPTSALDVSVQAQILNLLKTLQRELGVSYLFITHNIGVVEYIADQVAVMNRGRIEEAGPARTVLEHPRNDYTRTLLAAVPRIAVTT
jgi:peptide/nickel transport system ATP-binding protein